MDVPREQAGFKESIKKIEFFLEKLKEKYDQKDFVAICLKELYKIIMTVGKFLLFFLLHFTSLTPLKWPNREEFVCYSKSCKEMDRRTSQKENNN